MAETEILEGAVPARPQVRRRKSRRGWILRIAGLVFIAAALVLAGYLWWNLWGTGFATQRAQDDLRPGFDRNLASLTPADAPDRVVKVPGDAVAIIRIPKIGVDKVVVEGTTVADLRKGPGHYSGTPLPGQIGNAAIAGHRTTYGAPFGSIDQLAEDDIITVETLSGSFDYRVMRDGVFIVKPNQVEVLDPTPEEATLTLTSCNPKYSARERIVVKAEYDLRANQPQPQAPPTKTRSPKDLDAGLSGSHTSRLPTLLWGLLAALVGGLWWLVFHRYSRWPTWVVGAIVFAPVLFVFYVFLERVLPSNY